MVAPSCAFEESHFLFKVRGRSNRGGFITWQISECANGKRALWILVTFLCQSSQVGFDFTCVMILANQHDWHFQVPESRMCGQALRQNYLAWLHNLCMTLHTCVSSVICVCCSYVIPLYACARQPLKAGCAIFSPLSLSARGLPQACTLLL